MRQIAFVYCGLIARHLKFLGIDLYQIGLTFLILALLAGVAFLARGEKHAAIFRLCPPWLYSLLLVVALFIIRLPTFLPPILNPDEGMFLAGAMKLRHYPVFWKSVDGITSGPLNYYVLTVLNLLGFPFDYATARLMNVICIGTMIAIVYLIARLFMADWMARLAPLPALAAAMAFRREDFIHYSSECVATLLIAFATWLLLAQDMGEHPSSVKQFAIGAVVALIPLAKLQAAPMAAAIALAALALPFLRRQTHKWRKASFVVAGGAAVVLGLLAFLTSLGLFGTFLQSYILSNILYADLAAAWSPGDFLAFCFSGQIKWYEIGMLAYVAYFLATTLLAWMRRDGNQHSARQLFGTAGIAALLYCCGAWWLSLTNTIPPYQLALAMLFGLAAASTRRLVQQPSLIYSTFYDLFAVLILLASLYAIYRPARPFPHYLVFLIFPISFIGVRVLTRLVRVDIDQRRSRLLDPAVAFVLITLAVPSFLRSKELKPVYESERWMIRAAAHNQCAACPLVNEFAKAGDLVTIWGWDSDLYVLTGTIPATRDSDSPWDIIPGPQRVYYRTRYMQDLHDYPPKLFLDAVGPGQFKYQDRDLYGYETFPELRDYVMSNFYLAGDAGGVRVFARRDTARK
jgi:hypothetical protein